MKESLAVEFIEVLINHLCVDMSVLGVEVERLLLSVAESVYHLPVVGEPGAERLEVDATVQLYNVPYLVVLHGEIFQEFAQRMVPESACLRILEIAEFLECPHIDTVFFHIHRTDNMVPRHFVESPAITVIYQEPLAVAEIHFAVAALRTCPVLITGFIVFGKIVGDGGHEGRSPGLDEEDEQ